MKLKDFIYRYSSFTIAKAAIVAGRTAILILSFRWLSATEFAAIAGALSFVEIVRAFTDLGAENIIYSRLSAEGKPLPNVVKKLVKSRFFVSFICSLSLGFVSGFILGYKCWPLLFLPFVSSIQNASVAFMQKSRNFGNILGLVFSVLVVAVSSVLLVLSMKPVGMVLLVMMIVPEVFSAMFGMLTTKHYWRQVLQSQRGGYFSKRLLPYVMPSLAVSVLVAIYSRLDIVLVRPLFGIAVQADYSIGFRMVEPIFIILSLASLSLLAELGAYQTIHARLMAVNLFNKLNSFLSLTLFIGVVFVGLFVRWCAIEFFTLSETASWVAFIFVLAIPVKLCNTFFTTLLQRGGLYRVVMFAVMRVFFATMLLGLGFGFLWGGIGVAIAALLAEIFNFEYQKRKVKQMLKVAAA